MISMWCIVAFASLLIEHMLYMNAGCNACIMVTVFVLYRQQLNNIYKEGGMWFRMIMISLYIILMFAMSIVPLTKINDFDWYSLLIATMKIWDGAIYLSVIFFFIVEGTTMEEKKCSSVPTPYEHTNLQLLNTSKDVVQKIKEIRSITPRITVLQLINQLETFYHLK